MCFSIKAIIQDFPVVRHNTCLFCGK